LIVVLACARAVIAACPPDCIGGGRTPATDCFLEFGGVSSTDESCTDGSASCDMDGTVNGVCTFGASVCVNVPGDALCSSPGLSASPTVRPARSPIARALGETLATLDVSATACTAPGITVPLRATLKGTGLAVSRLRITAAAGRKKDRNALRLTCRPSPASPSFTSTILPIFAAHCALPACHDAGPSAQTPLLEGPDVYAAVVDATAANVPSMMLVHPGSVAESYLARKILGKRIPDHTARMPQGCPGSAPSGGCLSDAEIAAIVSWIQTGAPDN
jgi:hypothetical protein